MFCSSCGSECRAGDKFCPACGASLEAVLPGEAPTANPLFTDRVVRGSDGVYRWSYELHLLKNPTIFLLVWKIFFFILLGIWGFILLLDLIDWGFSAEHLLKNLQILGWFLLGMTGLVGISTLIYAAIMGGKYCVLFEMDEAGVNHRQVPAQAEKARQLGKLTVAAGLAGRRISTVSAGMAAQRTEMYSDFSKVRRVKVYPRRELIKVNGLLQHNQVYAKGEDFGFVRDFILTHCKNRKS